MASIHLPGEKYLVKYSRVIQAFISEPEVYTSCSYTENFYFTPAVSEELYPQGS